MSDTKPKRSRTLNAAALLAVVVGSAMTAQPAPATETVSGLTRYCSACWRNARLPSDVWPDCTQEVFVRLLERVPQDSWNAALNKEGDERRELVRAIDCVKKRVQRSKTAVAYPELGVPDHASNVAQQQAEDREFLAKAAELLPSRQWEILKLWATGHEAADIAKTMDMTPARVSDEKYKAIRRLREQLELETSAA